MIGRNMNRSSDNTQSKPSIARRAFAVTKRGFTVANVIATIALLIAMSGTSYAVKKGKITGKQIKDNSLTGADVKNNSLQKNDLSKTALSKLVGPAGDKGATGPKGDTGEKGEQGSSGQPGTSAEIAATWASRDTGRYVTDNLNDPPNAGALNWNNAGYNGGNVNSSVSKVTLSAADIDTSSTTVLSTEGTDSTNDGVIGPVTYNSNVSGVASLTLKHNGTVHSRAECQLFMSLGTDSSGLFEMGDPVYASSNTDSQLVNLSIIGSKNEIASSMEPETYNIHVNCRDADWDGSNGNKWEFVRGNLTAYASKQIDDG